MTLPWIYRSKCLLVTSGTIPLKLPQKGALGSHIKIISGNRDQPGVTQTVLKGRSCNEEGVSCMVHPPAVDLDHQRFSRIIMVGKGQRGHVRIQVVSWQHFRDRNCGSETRRNVLRMHHSWRQQLDWNLLLRGRELVH